MVDEQFHIVDRSMLWGFDGTDVPSLLVERMQAGLLSGITLFRYFNSLTKAVAAEVVAELGDTVDGLPLLIAVDQEAGQLRGVADTVPFAGNLALGAVDDVGLTEAVGDMIGRELRSVGITMNYSPVADVMSRPGNPSLGIRSFGSDPGRVADHTAALVRGLRRGGVLTVAKHFPGKGEAQSDPHHDLPVLDVDVVRLEAIDLPPFRAAVDAGVDAVMVGHYALPGLHDGREDLPASVSPAVVEGMLRRDLGFGGLAITDALDMGSLAQGAGSLIEAVGALRASVDLLLCAADIDRAEELSSGLRLAYSRGLLTPEAVAGGHARIQRARIALASLTVPAHDAAEAVALADDLARRAVTLVRDEVGLIPVAGGSRVASIMVEPTDLTPAETSSHEPPGLAAALSRRFDVAHDVVVPPEPSGDDVERAVAAAADADVAVVGTITARKAQGDLVRAVQDVAPTITVALRTPFDLSLYPSSSTHVCTYGLLEPSLHALADALATGSAPGRLPCPIGELHPRGHGLPR